MDNNKFMELLKKNWKYLSGAVIFVIIIIVLIQVSPGSKDNKDDSSVTTTADAVATTSGETTPGSVLNLNEQLDEKPIATIENGTDVYKGIEDLVNQYFTAMTSADVDSLKSILNQVTEADEQEVSSVSQRTENYENVKLRLVKSGMESGSYVAFVSYEGKYVGVDTLAPGLISFYICTREDGSLYIYNNLDDDAKLYVYTMREEDEEVEALRKEIENAYTQALNSDATLREFVEALQSGEATATPQPTQTPQETQQPQATQTPQPEATQAPQETQKPSNNDVSSAGTVVAVDNVNVRNNPSQTADTIGSLEKGQSATRLGTEGEWTKIQYKGSEGYVKTEFLKAGEAGSATSSKPDTFKIVAKETVNIRNSMSESAERVGVAYQGDKFDCVMQYQDGWSKIIYNGAEAYVKTEFFEKQ